MARCPAHDDRKPSLSIRDADDGKVLVRCHAGCDQARVIAALRSRGLWIENGPRRFTRSAPRVAGAPRPDRDDGPTHQSRACHLAVRDAGRTARWSRPISPRAGCIFHRRRRSASMPG